MKTILILESIHQVLRAEKILKAAGIGTDLIPVPRQISSDCGMAVELPGETESEAIRLLAGNGIEVRQWTRRDEQGGFHPGFDSSIAQKDRSSEEAISNGEDDRSWR
jgi:hypothetical protein